MTDPAKSDPINPERLLRPVDDAAEARRMLDEVLLGVRTDRFEETLAALAQRPDAARVVALLEAVRDAGFTEGSRRTVEDHRRGLWT